MTGQRESDGAETAPDSSAAAVLAAALDVSGFHWVNDGRGALIVDLGGDRDGYITEDDGTITVAYRARRGTMATAHFSGTPRHVAAVTAAHLAALRDERK